MGLSAADGTDLPQMRVNPHLLLRPVGVITETE